MRSSYYDYQSDKFLVWKNGMQQNMQEELKDNIQSQIIFPDAKQLRPVELLGHAMETDSHFFHGQVFQRWQYLETYKNLTRRKHP